jgi:cysteine-rich repeat protein
VRRWGHTPACRGMDDGNIFGGDGCNSFCMVEEDFFCPSAQIIVQVKVPPQDVNLICCRQEDIFSMTSMCTRCTDREVPFVGVRFSDTDCELGDVDECREGTDGCVLQPGAVSCANLDPRANEGRRRFECICAPGLFVSDQGCITERFVTQFELVVDHLEYPNAVELVRKYTALMLTGLTADILVEGEGPDAVAETKGLVRVKVHTHSRTSMQNITGSFDISRLINFLQSSIRE